jgi:hypothetical protein
MSVEEFMKISNTQKPCARLEEFAIVFDSESLNNRVTLDVGKDHAGCKLPLGEVSIRPKVG